MLLLLLDANWKQSWMKRMNEIAKIEEKSINQSFVPDEFGPSSRDVAIFADVGSNNGFTIGMVSTEDTPEAEGGLHIPCLFARAEAAGNVDRALVHFIDLLPHQRLLKVNEQTSEKHVFPFPYIVNTPWPTTNVEVIVPEPSA